MILRALASNEASPNLSQPIATRGGSTHVASLTGLVGFLGYGAGLVLFVYALRPGHRPHGRLLLYGAIARCDSGLVLLREPLTKGSGLCAS